VVTIQSVRIHDGDVALPVSENDAKGVTVVNGLNIAINGSGLLVPRSVFAHLIET
jgi:hypothetical protein